MSKIWFPIWKKILLGGDFFRSLFLCVEGTAAIYTLRCVASEGVVSSRSHFLLSQWLPLPTNTSTMLLRTNTLFLTEKYCHLKAAQQGQGRDVAIYREWVTHPYCRRKDMWRRLYSNAGHLSHVLKRGLFCYLSPMRFGSVSMRKKSIDEQPFTAM